MKRIADEVERKSDCVRTLRAAGHQPSAELLEDLREDTEFLQYLNEVVNSQ